MARLEIEHILPRAKGGRREIQPLVELPAVQSIQGDRTLARDPETGVTALFNPRLQVWTEHFRWSADGLRVRYDRRSCKFRRRRAVSVVLAVELADDERTRGREPMSVSPTTEPIIAVELNLPGELVVGSTPWPRRAVPIEAPW